MELPQRNPFVLLMQTNFKNPQFELIIKIKISTKNYTLQWLSPIYKKKKKPSKLHNLVNPHPPIVINIKSWHSDSIISPMESHKRRLYCHEKISLSPERWWVIHV
jgi:hypothetical protein